MPPVIPPRGLRSLKQLAGPQDLVNALTSQQGSGISGQLPPPFDNGEWNSPVILTGSRPAFPATNYPSAGQWTAAVGLDVLENGNPVLRIGLMEWWNPYYSVGTTFFGAVLLDNQGRVRVTFTATAFGFFGGPAYGGILSWLATGEFGSYIAEFD